jgi:hypothetical protein
MSRAPRARPYAIAPLQIGDAKRIVARFHRTHRTPSGGLWAHGLVERATGLYVGAAIVGRPVSRALCDGWTVEVTRVAVRDGVPNGCSMLLARAWRTAREMEYRRVVTYTLESEPGTSLRASGYRVVGEVKGKPWNRIARPRLDKHPLDDKLRWERET